MDIIRGLIGSNKNIVSLFTQLNKGAISEILDQSENYIFVKNNLGEYIFINKKVEEFGDIKRADILGKTDAEIYPAEFVESFTYDDKLVIETKKPLTNESTYDDLDGKSCCRIVNKFPLFDSDNEIIAVGGIVTDITNHYNARVEIEKSEKSYRTLVSNIQGVVFRRIYNSDMKVQFISEYIETLTGYSAAEFLSEDYRTLASIIHPDDYKRVYDRIDRQTILNEPYIIEYRIICKDKTIK